MFHSENGIQEKLIAPLIPSVFERKNEINFKAFPKKEAYWRRRRKIESEE